MPLPLSARGVCGGHLRHRGALPSASEWTVGLRTLPLQQAACMGRARQSLRAAGELPAPPLGAALQMQPGHRGGRFRGNGTRPWLTSPAGGHPWEPLQRSRPPRKAKLSHIRSCARSRAERRCRPLCHVVLCFPLRATKSPGCWSPMPAHLGGPGPDWHHAHRPAGCSVFGQTEGQRRKQTGLSSGGHLTWHRASCAEAPARTLTPGAGGRRAGTAWEAAALAGPSWAACTPPAASWKRGAGPPQCGAHSTPGPQVWASGSAVCRTCQPWGGGGGAMPGAQVGTREPALRPAVHMGGPPGQAVLTGTRGQRRAGQGPSAMPPDSELG